MPTSSPLTDILQSFDLLMTSSGQPGSQLDALLEQWEAFFAPLSSSTPLTQAEIDQWQTQVNQILATPDRQAEMALIAAANTNYRLGMALVVATIPAVMKRQGLSWWNQLFAEQAGDGKVPGWNIKYLPKPGPGVGGAPGTKYLIFSDVHRDAASDDLGVLEFGSIDHFKKNATLYENLLDWAIADNGYTVIEAGDCEELWFMRSAADYPKKPDNTPDIAAKLGEIVDTHSAVYDRLCVLHSRGQYFRIQGNHDSFLKDDGADTSVGDVMRERMQRQTQAQINAGAPVVPFVIYDACVIENVRTMTEKAALSLLTEVADLVAGNSTPAQYVQSLLQGRLGLDSTDYDGARSNLLICHGHQFDFWNCPANEILGMLIANTVGVKVDTLMDPFIDARGIAWQGSPLFDFGDFLAGVPVLNSWPDKQAAVRFAHQIQHMDNSARVLNDNVMFYESVAALYGAFGMALNFTDAAGNVITPAQSRAQLTLLNPLDLATYLSRHHMHQICIGHTHAPHSQPYLTLKNIGGLCPPLWPITTALRIVLPNMLQPQIKTNYFNSGTVGWMEGVAWAIEVDTTGQARLVYWTENSIGPEYMDWELQPMPAATRQKLLAGMGKILATPYTVVEQGVDTVLAKLTTQLDQLNISARAIKDGLTEATVLPMHAIAAALMTPPSFYEDQAKAARSWILKEVHGPAQQLQDKIDEGVRSLKDELEKLRGFSLDILLSVKRRALSGFDAASALETFEITAPITAAARTTLLNFGQMYKDAGQAAGEALHYAGLAFSIFDQFPRNMPFFATMSEPQHAQARLFSAEAPVLQALLATLSMYPPSGHDSTVSGVKITSVFSVQDKTVKLRVAIAAPDLPNV